MYKVSRSLIRNIRGISVTKVDHQIQNLGKAFEHNLARGGRETERTNLQKVQISGGGG